MARIRIEELPDMEDISEKELKGIVGGINGNSPGLLVPAVQKGFFAGRGKFNGQIVSRKSSGVTFPQKIVGFDPAPVAHD